MTVELLNTNVPALLYSTQLKPNDVMMQRTNRPVLLYSAMFEQQEGDLNLQICWTSCHFTQPAQFWRYLWNTTSFLTSIITLYIISPN
jgi:hypothetical protein